MYLQRRANAYLVERHADLTVCVRGRKTSVRSSWNDVKCRFVSRVSRHACNVAFDVVHAASLGTATRRCLAAGDLLVTDDARVLLSNPSVAGSTTGRRTHLERTCTGTVTRRVGDDAKAGTGRTVRALDVGDDTVTVDGGNEDGSNNEGERKTHCRLCCMRVKSWNMRARMKLKLKKQGVVRSTK